MGGRAREIANALVLAVVPPFRGVQLHTEPFPLGRLRSSAAQTGLDSTRWEGAHCGPGEAVRAASTEGGWRGLRLKLPRTHTELADEAAHADLAGLYRDDSVTHLRSSARGVQRRTSGVAAGGDPSAANGGCGRCSVGAHADGPIRGDLAGGDSSHAAPAYPLQSPLLLGIGRPGGSRPQPLCPSLREMFATLQVNRFAARSKTERRLRNAHPNRVLRPRCPQGARAGFRAPCEAWLRSSASGVRDLTWLVESARLAKYDGSACSTWPTFSARRKDDPRHGGWAGARRTLLQRRHWRRPLSGGGRGRRSSHEKRRAPSSTCGEQRCRRDGHNAAPRAKPRFRPRSAR